MTKRKPDFRNATVKVGSEKMSNFKAQYDAVSTFGHRRDAAIETTSENGQNSMQLNPLRRLQMLNLVRDATRNFSLARNIVRQLANNVLGTDFKLTFRGDEEEYREAEKWYNKKFAKDCMFKSRQHLSQFQHLALQTIIREGDIGIAFDRDILQTGKLIPYESDQICDPPRIPYKSWTACDGVLLDRYGREVGYCTTNRHGCTIAPEDDYTIWRNDMKDERNNVFNFVRTPWRFGQTRGDGQLWSCIADILDCYEVRAKELQTAKAVATMAAKVTHSTVNDQPEFENVFDPSLTEEEALDALNGQKNSDKVEDAPALQNYTNLEALTGGNTIYLDEGDDAQFMDAANRPSLNMEEFARRITKDCCAGAGLAGCYADLTPSGSYFSFRGELLMTWTTVKVWQKFIERNLQDWVAERAIQFAQDMGFIPQLPEDWRDHMQFQHPTMPLIDTQKEAAAFQALVRNGQTSLRDEMGAGYKDVLDQLSQEISDFRARGIPHPLFQSVAGAQIKLDDDGDLSNENTNSEQTNEQ